MSNNNTANQVICSLNAASKRKFKDAAKVIPSDVKTQLEARAAEGVASGEPHKATGGWVASPFYGKHDIMGLLEIASNAVKTEQIKAFRAA